MNKKKHIYSVFSGTFYEIPENDLKILDIGQIPLKNKHKNCSKCFSRGYLGRDTKTFAYQICNCIRKNIDFDSAKSLLPENNN
jgi:hypothetical protein